MLYIVTGATAQSIEEQENKLVILFEQLRNQKENQKTDSVNNLILRTFKKTLELENSFRYEFEKLDKISKQTSSDYKVKLYNWNIQYKDGSFKYFCLINYKINRKTYKVIELNDKSDEISKPENLVLNNKNWYGALYYAIIVKKYKGNKFYTLLGWDGNDSFTSKKLIDILTFDENDNAVFGAPILKFDNIIQKRVQFEFTEQVSMLLRYDDKIDMIVWDRLAPSSKELTGQAMYYGPSFINDGMSFEKGFWVLYKDLDLKNREENKTRKELKYGY